MGMQEVNARVSNGTLIEWKFDPEIDTHEIIIIDDGDEWSLYPRNGREAIEMFQHTYTYDWTLRKQAQMDHAVYDVDRGELVPRS